MTEEKLSLTDKIKKYAGWILVPFGLILLALKFLREMNQNAADQSIKSSQREDQKLEVKQTKLEEQAKVHEAKADEIQAEIDRGRKESVDSDWHKK